MKSIQSSIPDSWVDAEKWFQNSFKDFIKSFEDADALWPLLQEHLHQVKDQWKVLCPVRAHIRSLADEKFDEIDGGVNAYLRGKYIVNRDYHYEQKAKAHRYRISEHAESIAIDKTTVYRLISDGKLTICNQDTGNKNIDMLICRTISLLLAAGCRLCELYSSDKAHFHTDDCSIPVGITQIGKAKAKKHINGQVEAFRKFEIKKPVVGMTASEFVVLHSLILCQIESIDMPIDTLKHYVGAKVATHFPDARQNGSHLLRKIYGLLSFEDAIDWKHMNTAKLWTKDLWFMNVLGHAGFSSGLHYRIVHFSSGRDIPTAMYIKELAEAHAMVRSVMATNMHLLDQITKLKGNTLAVETVFTPMTTNHGKALLYKRDGTGILIPKLGHIKRKRSRSGDNNHLVAKVQQAIDILVRCDVKITRQNVKSLGISSSTVKIFKDSLPEDDRDGWGSLY